jgi:hypothetical protein
MTVYHGWCCPIAWPLRVSPSVSLRRTCRPRELPAHPQLFGLRPAGLTSIEVPLEAANIKSPMMLSPEALTSPSRDTVHVASKPSTTSTSLAEARACRPFSLTISGAPRHACVVVSSGSCPPRPGADILSMYLRPASGPFTASGTVQVPGLCQLDQHRQIRAVEDLRSIRAQARRLRFEGDPPNMSVTTTTPSPESTLSAAAQISDCLAARSWFGSIEIARIPFCRPTTCSTPQVLPRQAAMRDDHDTDHASPRFRDGTPHRAAPVPDALLIRATLPLQAYSPALARATERCWPPVQPKAMEKCALPSSRYRPAAASRRGRSPCSEDGRGADPRRCSPAPGRARRAGAASASQCGFRRNRQSNTVSTPARNAALVGKGLHRHGEPRVGIAGSNHALDLVAQLVRGKIGGVDQHVRLRADRGQHLDLALDAHAGRLGRGQRVTAAGFGIAPVKHVGLGNRDRAPRPRFGVAARRRIHSATSPSALKSRFRASSPRAMGFPVAAPPEGGAEG